MCAVAAGLSSIKVDCIAACEVQRRSGAAVLFCDCDGCRSEAVCICVPPSRHHVVWCTHVMLCLLRHRQVKSVLHV